jgi:hypothetical protein
MDDGAFDASGSGLPSFDHHHLPIVCLVFLSADHHHQHHQRDDMKIRECGR